MCTFGVATVELKPRLAHAEPGSTTPACCGSATSAPRSATSCVTAAAAQSRRSGWPPQRVTRACAARRSISPPGPLVSGGARVSVAPAGRTRRSSSPAEMERVVRRTNRRAASTGARGPSGTATAFTGRKAWCHWMRLLSRCCCSS
ncbi:hypothetical protein T492DRAFT_1076506 [Pavlovales sp. CCMP2436]|nr:hypothetical protein T492DRAFT_1076506 [Pavlovales sp. CCMP2436]